MKFNNKLSALFILIALFVLVTACSSSQQPAPSSQQQSAEGDKKAEETQKAAPLPEVVSLATKEAGSRSYTAFVPLADVITKYSGTKMVIETVGGIGSWGSLMEKEEVEFGQEEAYGTLIKFRGIREFEGQKPATYLRQVLAGYPATVTYVARADSGIEKIADMAGKSFFTDVPSIPVMTWESDVLLKKYGVADKVNRLKAATLADAAQQVIEGRASGVFYAITAPVAEIDRAVGVKLLSMTQGDIDDLNADLSAQVVELALSAPPDYLGIKAKTDVLSAATRILLLAHENTPDELVYNAMEAVYSHYEEVAAGSPMSKEFTLENAVKSQVIPFHPGAVKFFKDKGLWNDEMEQNQQKQLQILEELKKK